MLSGKVINDSKRLAMLMDFHDVGHEHGNVAGVMLISSLSLISICYQTGQ